MKKLLLVFTVLGIIASCGKDNKVSSLGNNFGITNPFVTGSTQAQGLVAMINNPSSFGQGQIISGSNTSNCNSKWGGFLQICTYGGGSSFQNSFGATWAQVVLSNPNIVYQYSNGRTVRNIDVNITTKQNELAAILNSATNVQASGPVYYITTNIGNYVIDTRYPIQINPSGVQTTSGTYYFLQAI